MKKKIYIAGKVTGEDQEQCITKFQNAKDLVEIMGYEAVNPLEVVGDWKTPWNEAMKKCIKALADCDVILMLDDWNFSKGAKLELQIALALGLDIHYKAEKLTPIRDPKRPRYHI